MESFSQNSSRSRSYESFFHEGVFDYEDQFMEQKQEQEQEEDSWDVEESMNTTSPPNDWFKNSEITRKERKNQVFLEGYVETTDEDELGRTKSLTDDDLDELKGCLDLGFGFSYEEIPELCNTLPALELCYSMGQKYLDEHQKSPDSLSDTASSGSGPIANWKISSPGDDPEDVKARLKFWAQAVACTVKLCS